MTQQSDSFQLGAHSPSGGRDSRASIRVLHVITTFNRSSGAAINTRITLNGLSRDRYRVFLAVPPGESAEESVAPDVTRLYVPSLRRSLSPLHDIGALLSLYRLCRRWRFDIVHTHNSKDGILGRWAAYLAGTPTAVHTIHNLSFRASRYRAINALYATLEKLTAPITKAFLGVSRENIREYLDQGIGTPERYHVVYSGLELERYRVGVSQSEARRLLSITTDAPLVAWFGRLNYQKDPLTFVRAAKLVLNKLPNVQFIVCGEDPIGEDLTGDVLKLVNELGLEKSVHFWGFRSDIPVILKAVDCVMHSSRYEGMGRVICEALLSDRPVAGTNVDGVREVVDSGKRGGILVEPGDAAGLAQATLELLGNPDKAGQLASTGRAWVETHLSADKMIADIEGIYRSLLDARHKAGRAKAAN